MLHNANCKSGGGEGGAEANPFEAHNLIPEHCMILDLAAKGGGREEQDFAARAINRHLRNDLVISNAPQGVGGGGADPFYGQKKNE